MISDDHPTPFKEIRYAYALAYGVGGRRARMPMIWDDHPSPWQPSPGEYFASGLLTGSTALKLYCRSPEAYQRHMRNAWNDIAMGRIVSAEKPSAAMVLGSAVDCMLTEPRQFRSRFAVTDSTRQSHVGRDKMTPAAYVKARKMAAAVDRHPRARELIHRPCLRQMCHRWQVDGVWYRLRADFVAQANDGTVILQDLKAWDVDAEEEWQVRRHAKRLGMYIQMALEGQGIEDLWGSFPIIALIIVSSRSPHKVVVRYLFGEELDAARMQVAEAQKGIAGGFQTGVFSDKIDEEIRAL